MRRITVPRPASTLSLVLAGATLALATRAHAGEIPIITLTETGPDQEVPTQRSFYLVGDAPAARENVQAIVVRKGSPSLFGDDGPDCHALKSQLRLDATSVSADDSDEADDELATAPVSARYPVGVHRVFELFPRAQTELHDQAVLVTAAWQRGDSASRQFRVLVPHRSDFFSTGYGYCLYVVSTERAQQVDDPTLGELVEGVARRLIGCGDKSSCDNEALVELEGHAAKALVATRAEAPGAPNALHAVAAMIKETARGELAAATGLVEARDHLADRWHGATNVMPTASHAAWADLASDPFAHVAATLLVHAGVLVTQGGAKGAVGYAIADGRTPVRELALDRDGRTFRVSTLKGGAGDAARVLQVTADDLDVSDRVTFGDLIELGHGQVRVDKEWITLSALGDRLRNLGLDGWTADDGAITAEARRIEALSHSG